MLNVQPECSTTGTNHCVWNVQASETQNIFKARAMLANIYCVYILIISKGNLLSHTLCDQRFPYCIQHLSWQPFFKYVYIQYMYNVHIHVIFMRSTRCDLTMHIIYIVPHQFAKSRQFEIHIFSASLTLSYMLVLVWFPSWWILCVIAYTLQYKPLVSNKCLLLYLIFAIRDWFWEFYSSCDWLILITKLPFLLKN